MSLLIDNKCARWVMVANSIRYIGFFCLLFYMPIFFTKTYPDRVNDFSQYNAIIDIIVANFSALIGGFLSDRLEKDTYYAKPGIIITSTLISGPIICAGLLQQDNFNFSIAMLGLHFIFA